MTLRVHQLADGLDAVDDLTVDHSGPGTGRCVTAGGGWECSAVPATDPRPLVFTLGSRELVIRRRYEALSIVNDVLIAVWFVIGSLLFLSEALTDVGTWFFVVGSVELLIRPVIRLTRHLHLARLPGRRGVPLEAGHDF